MIKLHQENISVAYSCNNAECESHHVEIELLVPGFGGATDTWQTIIESRKIQTGKVVVAGNLNLTYCSFRCAKADLKAWRKDPHPGSDNPHYDRKPTHVPGYLDKMVELYEDLLRKEVALT